MACKGSEWTFFLKKIYKWPISTMKRCSVSLARRERRNIATMRYQHFTLTEATVLKRVIIGVGKHAEKLEVSYTTNENIKWHSHFGKQSGSSSKS